MTLAPAAALAATAVVVATAVCVPAPAHAQGSARAPGSALGSTEALPALFPAPDRLVAAGGSPTGACAGVVTTTLSGDGYPATSAVSWAFAVVGVGPCELTATLSWRNLDTGATGEKVARIPVPRISTGVPDPISHPYEAMIPTGSGPVEYLLTTTGGAMAGPLVITTAAYPG